MADYNETLRALRRDAAEGPVSFTADGEDLL